MSREAQIQQWEKHLAKIIEQANKNISCSRSHEINGPPIREVPPPPQPSPNTDDAYITQNQAGYHQLQAQHVIQGTSVGFVNRPVPKQVEEDLSDRIQLTAKRTVEKAISDKMHSTHLRIDRLSDKIGTLSEDGVKIHREYGLLARSIASQERLTKRLKQEYESQKVLVTKLGEAMASDVGWKESTNIDLKMIKDQLRQDSATCVTTTDMKNALESITSKTMLAMERSTMSAKIAFENDIALLKQEMQHLKEENEKLKIDLLSVHDTSRVMLSKLEPGNIKAVITNAVDGQLEKIEHKVLSSVTSSIERDLFSSREMMTESVIETIKDVLGREMLQGGGDFHRVIGGIVLKLLSNDRVPRNSEENDIIKIVESRFKSTDDDMDSRLKTLEKQVEKIVSHQVQPPADYIEEMFSSIENMLITQVRESETHFKAYCDDNIDSCNSKVASINTELELIMQSIKGSSDDIEHIQSNLHEIKEKIGGSEMLSRIITCENSLDKNENSLKVFVDGIQNELKSLTRQMNDLESRDFNKLHYDLSTLRSTVELLLSSKNYSVEDLASCMGKVNMLESKFRHEIHSLRGEFVDLQGNVFDQNSASAERIELLIKQVNSDVAKLTSHSIKNDRVEQPLPEFITYSSNPCDDVKVNLESLQKQVDNLNEGFKLFEHLNDQVDFLGRKLSSQGDDSSKLADCLRAIETKLVESPRHFEKRQISHDNQVTIDVREALISCDIDSGWKTQVKNDIEDVNQTNIEQEAETARTTNEFIDSKHHSSYNTLIGDQTVIIDAIENRCVSDISILIGELANNNSDSEMPDKFEGHKSEVEKMDDSNKAPGESEYHRSEAVKINVSNNEEFMNDTKTDSKQDRCVIQVQEKMYYEIAESIDGYISESDELECVATFIAGDLDDTTIASSSSESDVSYESDFEDV